MSFRSKRQSTTATATVKLFPRLAPVRVLATQVERGNRAEVRARLLKMILDNERARRFGDRHVGDRPNAS
jgi:hypothetical protein